MFREVVTFCFENHTKHKIPCVGKILDFLKVKWNKYDYRLALPGWLYTIYEYFKVSYTV